MTKATQSVPGELRYNCLFCNNTIEPNDLDPCALMLIARIDRSRREQKEQGFYCHVECLQRASKDRRSFYILEHDFDTVGEIEDEAEEGLPDFLPPDPSQLRKRRH